MGNFNTPALLFGLILLVASIALFLYGRLKPELQRDSDSVYAIIGIVCALILFASAFELSLGMSFQQLLMIGSLIALMWENIQARQPRAPVARRGTFENLRRGMGSDRPRRGGPLDDDRPPASVYRYEASLDDYDRYNEPRLDQRRIRGSEPPRGGGYDDRYDEPVRRPRPSLNDADRPRDIDRDSDFERGRGGRDDFAPRPEPPARRPAESAPQRNARPNAQSSDWQTDNYVDGRRSPAAPVDGFGPERNPGSRGGRAPRVRDDRSMEGRPMSRPLEEDARPDMGREVERGIGREAGREGGSSEFDRPALDMPPRRRPRPNGSGSSGGPGDRPPLDGPMDGAVGFGPSDRPLRRPTSAGGRPVIDRPVIEPPSAGSRPMTPPPAAGKPSGAPLSDDYVDFKPVTPPPASEVDNSDQFDD